jgi:hypothetical protein
MRICPSFFKNLLSIASIGVPLKASTKDMGV